jgi:PAS domain S-box-containing protein
VKRRPAKKRPAPRRPAPQRRSAESRGARRGTAELLEQALAGGGALAELFLECPLPMAALEGDRVVAVNRLLARALRLPEDACAGRLLADLLPPEGGRMALPEGGAGRSYRTLLDGASARVDLALAPRCGMGCAVVRVLEPSEAARRRAFLALSRDLASARDEEQLTAGAARALEALFPGRSYAVRLVDERTLTLTASFARGRFRAGAQEGLSLRRAAVRKTKLSEPALASGGLLVNEADVPVFEGCDRATAVPLALTGELFGVLNLEYATGAPGDRGVDEPVLLQVANQVAVAVRNLRSVEEVTYLKSFLEDLIENANALIVVVNLDRETLVFNRALARLTGWAREEVLGEELSTLVAEGDRRKLGGLLDRAFEGAQATGVELRLALRSGGEARVVVNTSAVYGSSGEVEGVILIGQDQTLLRALQEKAEQGQRLVELGRIAAGVVHELNNPLTAVTAYAEALVEKLSLAGHEAADVEKLRRILDAGKRIQRFARDLMAYARPPRHEMEFVDLSRVVEEATRMCEPALRAAGARVEQRFEEVPPVWGQRGRLLQVFVNLVTNAAHALEPRGGTVTLELAPAGEHVAARVKDDGAGMMPEVKRRAFEPFFTTKGDGQGSGLGLSIVESIVSRHGGAISLETERGVGTTFTVMLPVSPARA